jgi:GGDEF domain-containing protein
VSLAPDIVHILRWFSIQEKTMSAQALAVWSMALGTIAALGLARLAQFAVAPNAAQLQAVGYHAAVFVLVLVLSGAGAHVAPFVDHAGWQVAQVLAGPLCVGISDLWIAGWLYAPHRDRLMAAALRFGAIALPLGAAACLLLPHDRQLPAAAGLALVGGTLTLWLTARGWRLGDRLAAVMAVGCLFTLPAISGLYAIAMQWRGLSLRWHVLFAVCAALSNAVTGVGLWRRARDEQHARRQPSIISVIDPVTQLRSGRSLVHRIDRAQRRRNRSGRDGAVLAILLFDLEYLRREMGGTGLHEIYIGLASRIQRRVGAVNVVGRYYEGCFIVLVDSIPSLPWLRTLSLRLAASLRRPLIATRRAGDRIELVADVAVGVVHLSRPAEAVDDVLADAQRMAVAARVMRSRTAICDPRSGEPIAMEEALLGSRRTPRALRPAA